VQLAPGAAGKGAQNNLTKIFYEELPQKRVDIVF